MKLNEITPCPVCGGGKMIAMTNGHAGWVCGCSDQPIPLDDAMTAEQSTEWVYEQDEMGEVDQDQLDLAFAALYGRQATDDDRQAGLWSLCCAATPNCGTRPE